MQHGKLYKILANRRQFQKKTIIKMFFIVLNTMGSGTIMKVVHFVNEVGHRYKSVSMCSDISCRGFHGASFKKIEDFIIYVCRDMREIKTCRNYFNMRCIILVDFENLSSHSHIYIQWWSDSTNIGGGGVQGCHL
jgi:hypothetical protein